MLGSIVIECFITNELVAYVSVAVVNLYLDLSPNGKKKRRRALSSHGCFKCNYLHPFEF